MNSPFQHARSQVKEARVDNDDLLMKLDIKQQLYEVQEGQVTQEDYRGQMCRDRLGNNKTSIELSLTRDLLKNSKKSFLQV